jgi:hypothetical protein
MSTVLQIAQMVTAKSVVVSAFVKVGIARDIFSNVVGGHLSVYRETDQFLGDRSCSSHSLLVQ